MAEEETSNNWQVVVAVEMACRQDLSSRINTAPATFAISPEKGKKGRLAPWHSLISNLHVFYRDEQENGESVPSGKEGKTHLSRKDNERGGNLKR